MSDEDFERRIGYSEIIRRLDHIENKLGNGSGGVYVRREVDQVEKVSITDRLKALEDGNRWMMRTLVAMLLGLMAEAVVIAFKLTGTG